MLMVPSHLICKHSQTIDISSGKFYTLTSVPNTGTTQTVALDGSVTAEYNQGFKNFLSTPGCASATICSLSLTLEGTPSVDFQLISSPPTSPIPDLNAVVISDGLSDNGLYFQRVIDLIPTRQDI